jgi:hypothetical protein
MKNRKEQKTKAQPKSFKKAIAESSATESKRTIKQVVIEAITANNVITNEDLIATVWLQLDGRFSVIEDIAWSAAFVSIDLAPV